MYYNFWLFSTKNNNKKLKSDVFIKNNYISRGQVSLYFQKYNVVETGNLYNNQYMQNIRGANDEGNIMYNSYNKSGILDSSFTFLIPVYENMTTISCPRPGNW